MNEVVDAGCCCRSQWQQNDISVSVVDDDAHSQLVDGALLPQLQ